MDLKRIVVWAWATALLSGAAVRAEDAPKPATPAPEVKPETKPDAKPETKPDEKKADTTAKADETKKDDPAPPKKKPQSLEEAIALIPVGDLEDGVLLAADPIKILYTAVEPMEKAAWIAHKRREPQWDFGPGDQAQLRKQIAIKLLGNAVVEQYAADNKLTAPEDKYKPVFDRFKQAKEARGGYERFLSDSGISDEAFQKFLRASVAIENHMAQSVTDDDCKKWLEEHKGEVGQRRVSEIMFTFKGARGAPESVKRTKEEAKKLADELLKKLRENANSDFPALVKDMSDGPSARNSGDLGYVAQKGTVDSIAEGVYKIEKVGEYSDVIESPFGYHVFKLTELRKDDDILKQVKDQLTSERFGAEMQKLMEDAVSKAKFNKKLLPEK